MLRGKQLVVVGDSKQLPPTSFFDTLNDNLEDEENITADMESILGMCDAQGAPQKMLRWPIAAGMNRSSVYPTTNFTRTG
jgi:superfamily I DNA and/or RNA helicase